VPKSAQFSIEHERGDDEEEVEFQLKWSLDGGDDEEHSDEVV
jgi:hypothetical protein